MMRKVCPLRASCECYSDELHYSLGVQRERERETNKTRPQSQAHRLPLRGTPQPSEVIQKGQIDYWTLCLQALWRASDWSARDLDMTSDLNLDITHYSPL